MKKLKFILISISLLFAYRANAMVSPLAVSLVPPVQFPNETFSATGVRLSVLWGQHRDVYGVDIGGIGNFTEQNFVGIGISSLFNVTHGTTTILGLQLAGAVNMNTQKTHVWGVQAAIGANINTAESSLTGLQIALANMSSHMDIYGMQVGLYNHAKSVYGLQVGLINEADDLHGLQIGLVNFNHKGLFAVAPILNAGF